MLPGQDVCLFVFTENTPEKTSWRLFLVTVGFARSFLGNVCYLVYHSLHLFEFNTNHVTHRGPGEKQEKVTQEIVSKEIIQTKSISNQWQRITIMPYRYFEISNLLFRS